MRKSKKRGGWLTWNAILLATTALGGMSQAEFDRCTNDQALFEGIKKLQLEAQQKYDVNATPTFIVVRGNGSEAADAVAGRAPRHSPARDDVSDAPGVQHPSL